MVTQASDKPYKGEITDWFRHHFDMEKTKEHYGEEPGLGYLIRGTFLNHPQFGYSRNSHTSWVVSFDEATGEFETRNSRYKVVGLAIGPDVQE